MTLIESQVKLFLQKEPGESDIYILESTAIFPNDNYVANGYDPLPVALNNTNELDINLNMSDGSNSNNSSSSTVIHTISLGDLNYGLDDFKINVYLMKGGTKKGKGHVRNVDAVMISKPDIVSSN